MICPKCGFDQPDDIYCAFCGVHIETSLKQKKRKRFKAGILALLVGIAVFSVALYLFSSRKNGHYLGTGEDRHYEGLVQLDKEARPGLKPSESMTASRDYGRQRSDNRRRSPRASQEGHGEDETIHKIPSHRDNEKGQPAYDTEGETGTESQWFEKGRALDDDSDAEIEYYEKAIKLDPEFAPAFFRLGAIYYRQAQYELADQEFANFIKYASDDDREAYDIYIYYSLADMDRLSRKVEEQAASQEVKEKEQTEKEEEKTGSDKNHEEINEEVMTIVKFSPVGGHIIVPVVLNDFFHARVLVDTGSGITIVSRELARELKLPEEPGSPITLKTVAMDIEAQLARLDSIQVGDLSRNNFPVAITDLPLVENTKFDGILGMDFMNNFKIHIDNEKHTIILTPKVQ